MAGLIPFNRRGLSTRFNNDFVNMIDDFFSDYTWPVRDLLHDTFKMDITEDDKAYHLEVELPGVKKDEIDLSLDNGRLTISVAREENLDKGEGKNFLHRERRYSSMRRSVFLRDSKDEDISAKLTDGVLEITVPKEEPRAEQGKRIEID